MAEIDSHKRMSESLLWELQETAYTQYGSDAWTQGLVPSSITSNPLIAKQYAQLAIAFIRDTFSSLDKEEPVIFFDLGAGSGRFAFLFLREFFKMLPKEIKDNVLFRYVMTDIADATFNYWRNHPYLKELMERGLLDFAFYQHHQEKGGIRLMQSQEVIQKTKNPPILLANYYFDTIPQDLFRIRGGKLEEGRIALKVEGKVDNPRDYRLIEKLECDYQYTPIEGAYYPDHPELDAVLEEYRHFPDCVFSFPIGGFQSLNYFSHLSGRKFLVLAGGHGMCTKEQIVDWGEPEILKHNTFSIFANYHALASYFRHLGGMSLLTSMPDRIFAVTASALGFSKEDLSETVHIFENSVDAFEPKDYWYLVSHAESEGERSLEEILLLLKLGNWDPLDFYAFFDRIRALISGATAKDKEFLRHTIHHIWEHVYVVSPEEGNFVMNLGVLLFEMKYFKEALAFFERSLKIGGDQELIRKNIAACKVRVF